ncbi:MAG: acetylxylan esterase [Chthonomonas sp.]|nr:acetylxylan esterase [Chthonomonas sp.]
MSQLFSTMPEDFDEFWAEVAHEAQSVRLDYHRSLRKDFPLDGFVVERLEFTSVGNRRISGWFAYPEGARRLPGFVWIPPYGRESLLPNSYGTREGFTSLSFNLHGEDAFHQEKYVPARGYFAEGAGSPQTFVFKTLVQHVMVGARVLQAQIETDEDKVAAMGMSQGAGLAIWAGAHSPVIKAVAADMPFLGSMTTALGRNAYRYPLKELVDFMEREPLGPEKVRHTLSYFDTVHQASRCKVPTLVSAGLKDPSVRPETVEAIVAALPGEHRHVIYDWGHDWHPEMIGNNRDWLLAHL